MLLTPILSLQDGEIILTILSHKVVDLKQLIQTLLKGSMIDDGPSLHNDATLAFQRISQVFLKDHFHTSVFSRDFL